MIPVCRTCSTWTARTLKGAPSVSVSGPPPGVTAQLSSGIRYAGTGLISIFSFLYHLTDKHTHVTYRL